VTCADLRSATVVAAALVGALGGHGVASAAAQSRPAVETGVGCDALDTVRAQFAVQRQALLNGTPEEALPKVDIVTPLRACFRDEVYPGLRRAETNDQVVFAAIYDYFAWRRTVEIMGVGKELAAESEQADASAEKGLVHRYGVARDKCRARPDPAQVDVMLDVARFAQLIGREHLFTMLQEDIQACTKATAYLITVRQRVTSAKRGEVSNFTYRAMLKSDPASGAGELAGTGRYAGAITTYKVNCRAYKNDPGERFTLSGTLEASGSPIDGTFFGKAKDSLTYILATTDWPLKMIFGDSPFAETAEERDGLKGLGTLSGFAPLPLTEPVSTLKETATTEGDDCSGAVTTTSDLSVQRLRAR